MIRPQLSFDASVKDVTDFYTSVFEGSTVNSYVSHQLKNSVFIEYSNITILDQEFIIMNNSEPIQELPALTFMLVYPKDEEKLARETFEKLKVDGTVYDPMNPEQPYGIVQDRYNMLFEFWVDEHCTAPSVITRILFAGDLVGKTDEAADFYTKIFKNSKKHEAYYIDDGLVETQNLELENIECSLYEIVSTNRKHTSNVAFALDVEAQKDLDYYWNSLKAEVFDGPLIQDKYGVFWFIEWSGFEALFLSASEDGKERMMNTMFEEQPTCIEGLKLSAEEN